MDRQLTMNERVRIKSRSYILPAVVLFFCLGLFLYGSQQTSWSEGIDRIRAGINQLINLVHLILDTISA